MKELSGRVISAIKSAAKKLTGVKRRLYQAEITNEFFNGNARKAELSALTTFMEEEENPMRIRSL